MRQDRGAARSPASSAAPAGRLPETLPRPCPDRGNNAAARRAPGDAQPSWPDESRRYRSRLRRPGDEVAQWTDFHGARHIDDVARYLDGLFERRAVHHVEAE